MKIENKKKLVANLHDNAEYVIYIRNWKQALNHGLVLKIARRVIKFNQNAWLKAYIDMITDLKKKKILENIFLSWWIIKFLDWENYEKPWRY